MVCGDKMKCVATDTRESPSDNQLSRSSLLLRKSSKNFNSCSSDIMPMHIYHFLPMNVTLLLTLLIMPMAIAAQDDVRIIPMNAADQPVPQNGKENQQKNSLDNVKGIPVAVSFPKGDYQW